MGTLLATVALVNTTAPAGALISPPTSASTPTSTSTTSKSTSSAGRPAQGAPPSTTSTTLDASYPAIELDSSDPRLVLQARAEVANAAQSLDAATATREQVVGQAAAAATRLFLASRQLDQLDGAQRAAVAAVRSAEDRLRAVAVAAYVTGGPGGPVSALLSAETIGDFARRRSIFAIVAEDRSAALHAYAGARKLAERSTLAGIDAVDGLTSAKADADRKVPPADAAVARAQAVLSARRALLNLVEDAATAPGTDIPAMVLDAYQRAAATARQAGCQLAWWGLAAVGRVESDHGRLQHARLTATGDLVPHIRGVPLDGSQDTQRISDPNGAAVQAEGPMQFIPSTWAAVGRDGNADGKADVDNIYDASLGAAAYLCRASAELLGTDGLTIAYRSYNRSDAYVAEVLAYARAYQAIDAAGEVPPPSGPPRYTLPGPPVPAGA